MYAVLGVDQSLHDPPWPQCMKGVSFQRQGTPLTDMFHRCHQPLLGRDKRGLSVAQHTESSPPRILHKGIIDLRTAFRYEYDESSGFGILRASCDGDFFQERGQCEQGRHDTLDQLDTEARSIGNTCVREEWFADRGAKMHKNNRGH